MKLLAYTYLVLAVFFGFIGVLLYLWWRSTGVALVVSLLNFLPAIVFLIAFFISTNRRLRKADTVHGVTGILCFCILFTWGLFTYGLAGWVYADTEITDVRMYKCVLLFCWGDNDLISHFPRPIPSDAKNVRFSFSPAFLQQGAHIQLRYSLDEKQIAELYDKFSSLKTKSFHGGSATDHANSGDGAMPTTSFYTSGSDEYEFPDDYEIMVLDPIVESYNWNHPRSHGVAISKKRNEIIYWAEGG